MKGENWKKVSGVLLDCLEIDESERRKYLDGLPISSAVRAEIESFLALEAQTVDFMSVTANQAAKDFLPPEESDENPLIGQQIGIYRIEKELGVGGMGAVYLASRADGKFDQKVAVKMLKREFNVEQIRRNFNREKEILAVLSHPNIAGLLDAGKTPDNIPYLVMEYVEGEPVDVFCRKNRLDLNARLKLFNKICEAVAFAHRNLVIHRDLKPSNILIARNGTPKLLDFGISKLLDENAAAKTSESSTTLFAALTPEYASPEQIKGEAVTTATDVYSLGVILFKLLTGGTPYNFKDAGGTQFKEMVGGEPLLPSQAAVESNFEAKIPASKIKGDLDNILLKSLAGEPERRYQTVEQFSADIWRFLDDLPVSARPATAAYRARKFYGRNRIAITAGALIFLSLLAGIAVAASQTRAARDAQRQAELNFAEARAEEEKAKEVSNFMMRIISYANPRWYAPGAKYRGETKVIEAMNELGDQIDVEFANQPDVQSELHHKFTEVYNFYSGDDYRRKETFHAVRALELRRQFYGDFHELVAKDLFYLSETLSLDDPQRAKTLMEAIEMMRRTNPNNLNLPYMYEAYAYRLLLPDALFVSENASSQSAAYPPARSAEEVRAIYRKAVQPATNEDNYRIAEKFLREALPLFRLHYKEDNTAIASNECVLAYALGMQNKPEEFTQQYAVCRQEEKNIPRDLLPKHKKWIELIEQIPAAKKSGNI